VKLLVVIEDEMMRICVTAILDALGYEIVEAKDGLEALLIYRARRAEIALIIMEIIMPRMDGIATTKVIKATDPTAKVILMGHPDHDLSEVPADTFIYKPFKAMDLKEAVRKVLQDDRPTSWAAVQP
jgi:two-component system, cell cycle sensor histidine kinase and response regulator CckA